MTVITLDDNHRYFVDGQPCEGVTEILKGAGLIPTLYHNDNYYLDRGRYVHEAIALYFKGTLDFEALAEGIKGFVESAIEYITRTGYKPALVEKMFYSPTFHYCGTMDAVPLHDWKSGGKSPWQSLQVAAYWNLLIENKICFERPVVVYLNGKGKLPKTQPYSASELSESFNVFASALKVLRWKKEKGLYKKEAL